MKRVMISAQVDESTSRKLKDLSRTVDRSQSNLIRIALKDLFRKDPSMIFNPSLEREEAGS